MYPVCLLPDGQSLLLPLWQTILIAVNIHCSQSNHVYMLTFVNICAVVPPRVRGPAAWMVQETTKIVQKILDKVVDYEFGNFPSVASIVKHKVLSQQFALHTQTCGSSEAEAPSPMACITSNMFASSAGTSIIWLKPWAQSCM